MLKSLSLAGTALSSAVLFASSASAMAADEQATQVGEVIVTGSRLAGAGRMSSIETVDSEMLKAAGISDMSQLTAVIASNSGSEARIDQLNNPQSSGTAQFNLRNLGLGSTLVLVDGQRWTNSAVVATDGSAFVDINSLIPTIALERVEIAKDGASAIYGSDAVAGVVNFITRKDTPPTTLQARYGATKGSDETSIEALSGLDTSNGRLLLAASYFHRSALSSDERDFTQAENYGRAAWTAVTSYGQPGSYYLPSLGQYRPDPDCDDPAFVGTYRNGQADVFCRLDYSDFFDLVPEETRYQLFADYRGQMGELETWAQASWASTETIARQSPSLPILSRSLTVPANHPDNPFGEDVVFRGRLLGGLSGASKAQFNYETMRLAGGLSGRFNSGWSWDVYSTYSHQSVDYRKPDVLGTPLQQALNGVGGTYYNPFGSALLGTGNANAPGLIEALAGETRLDGRSDLWTLDAQTSGQVYSSAALAVDIVAGLQYRSSGFRHDWNEDVNSGDLLTAGYSPDFDGRQEAYAAYVEGRAKIGSSLETQMAARYESYGDNSGKISPKLAVRWDATELFALRGSIGTSYRAPSVYTIHGAQAAQPSVLDGGSFVFVNTLTSGDPALRPERSEHLTYGLLWQPSEGFSLAVDRWRYDYSDLVIKEAPQPIIDRARADDAAGLSGTDAQNRVTRNASGGISMVQLYFVNASSILTEGMDVTGRYQRPVFDGQLSLKANWSWVDRYDIRVAADGPVVSGLGSTNLNTIGRSLPEHRGEFSATWENADHTLTALVHHTGSYSNDRAGITRAYIASQTTADLHYTLKLTPDLQLNVGAVNIFDKAPPLAQFFLAYDPVTSDPRGRVLSIGLRKTF